MPDRDAGDIVRAIVPAQPRTFGTDLVTVGAAGGRVGRADIVRSTRTCVTREYRVFARDGAHAGEFAGVIGTTRRSPIAARDDLSMASAPGVARVCMAIHHDFEQAWGDTTNGDSVMVVSGGSDVPGVGDATAAAALPACEAGSLLLRELAGNDAHPLPVNSREVEKITDAVAVCGSVFARIHL